MSKIDISVVMPAYNAEKTIEYALDSIRAQTLPPLEVIVVDDGSSDCTFLKVSNYITDHSLSNWHLLRRKNGGPAFARDAAINLSRGSYIALLDADDVWAPEKLEASMAQISLHTLDIVGARLRSHSTDGPCNVLNSRQMLFSNPYFTSTVVFSRAAYYDVGGFDLNQRYSEDYKLWLAFAWRGKRCGQMARTLAIYRSSTTSSHRGLSSNLWCMQKSEIGNFRWLHSKGMLPTGWYLLAQAISWLKFAYRAIRAH